MPAVVLVHEPFEKLARTQCVTLGAKDPLILVYKQDAPALESNEQSAEKARSVAAEVLRMLTA
jgi:hypothetical protein